MIVDSAIYVDGRRLPGPGSISETYEVCQAAGGLAWIGLLRPAEEQFGFVSAEFGERGPGRK